HALDRSKTPPLSNDSYVYVTLHRAELVDDPDLLRGTLQALGKLGKKIIFGAHPRTASAITKAGVSVASNIDLRPPVGYLDNLALVRGATAVVTDSGGLQREAYWLGIPCVTLRRETEWVETLECGANRL